MRKCRKILSMFGVLGAAVLACSFPTVTPTPQAGAGDSLTVQALTQAAVKTDRCAIVASLLASELNRMDTLGLEITNALKDIFARQQEEPVEPVMKEDVAEIFAKIN